MKIANLVLCGFLLVTSMAAQAQEGKPQIRIGGAGLQTRDVLSARPKADAPAPLPNGRPAKLDQTPYSTIASISWRSAKPTVEFKIQGAGPFPKTGVLEIYATPPALTNASAGLTLTPTNQVKILPQAPLFKTPITTGPDGVFTATLSSFAPKVPRGNGLLRPSTGEGAPVDLTTVSKIQANGYVRYYARVVAPSGASSTNAIIEYGEALPAEIQSNLQAKNPAQGQPWLTEVTSFDPFFSLRWWALDSGAVAAAFQLSKNPFPDDARTWRNAALIKFSGSVPGNSPDGMNLFGLDLTNYLTGRHHVKGDFYLRIVPLKANGDLAAQPSNAIQLHLAIPPAQSLAACTFEIRTNPSAPATGEAAEKPSWGTSAILNPMEKDLFRWSTPGAATSARVLVRRIDDWSNDVVLDEVVAHQGDFELALAGKLAEQRGYEVSLQPLGADGKQIAQTEKVIISTTFSSMGFLPPAKTPPGGAPFNYDVSVQHYQPRKGEILYHYVLSKEPQQGGPVNDAYYKLYQQLTGHASPHKGDKVYMPPKPDNGKSWNDYVSDGVSFVAGIISWAESSAIAVNSYWEKVKQGAAEGISSATGIPVQIVRMGIDIGLQALGVPENPFELPLISEVGADYLTSEILDVDGANALLRDTASGAIKSGLDTMAKTADFKNDPNAPILVPDPDFGDKPALMTLLVKGSSTDPNLYGACSPVSIRVENWYENNGAKDHVVLFETTVMLPKVKAGQTIRVPVALRYSKAYYDERGRWETAYSFGTKSCRFTVDGKIMEHLSCDAAWP
jgi:hypothetical protein